MDMFLIKKTKLLGNGVMVGRAKSQFKLYDYPEKRRKNEIKLNLFNTSIDSFEQLWFENGSGKRPKTYFLFARKDS